MSGIVESINIGSVTAVPWGKLKRSGIDKHPVEGPVRVHRLGVEGDEIADLEHHGGETQAVYAYAAEDLHAWSERLGRELSPGQFGENLTVRGLDLTHAPTGQRWQVGSAVLEVTKPRIPCSVFQGHLGEGQWVKRFAADGAPGAYLSVVTAGEISPGDDVHVVEPGKGPTILELFRQKMPAPADAQV